MKRKLIALGIILIIMLTAGCVESPTGKVTYQNKDLNTLEKIKETGKIRIGYAGYPPYLKKDPLSGDINGFSVDLIKLILEYWERDIQIEWVETSWERNLIDIKNDKFDIMVEPVFQLIPRASEVGFTEPYTYFGYGVAIVSIDNKKIETLDDLNDPAVTIAVGDGSASQKYADKNFPEAKKIKVSAAKIDSAFEQVIFDKADVALGETATVKIYSEQHKEDVKPLFLENPPAKTPAGFLIKKEDLEWKNFLDTSIRFIRTSGELEELCRKYNLTYYENTIEAR